MNERSKTGLQILAVAISMGLLADSLLRVTPWGLNVLLFNVGFAAALAMLLKTREPGLLNGQTIALMCAQVLFSAMFVWRDSIELRIADSAAILAILSVMVLGKLNVSARLAGVFHYACGFVWASMNALGAPFVLVFGDIEWANISKGGWQKHAVSALRGIAIAAPLVLIFGGLFVAADAAFEGMVQQTFDFVPEIVFSHILLFGLFAWLSAGYLRGVLLSSIRTAADGASTISVVPKEQKESRVDRVREESGEYPVTLSADLIDHLNLSDPPDAPAAHALPKEDDDATKKWTFRDFDSSVMPKGFTLGSVEIGVVLGLMNLLFLSFVTVQVRYLFGGLELVQNTPDFKLAEYARRGFGELVAVSALVLPILLLSHWLIRRGDRFAGKLFNWLAGVQIALLFVIMASAIQRLWLLTGDLGYGLTTIRLYPLIFMFWLAIVFCWFAMTVFRGARQQFAWGALWSAFMVLGATHALNPDAFIVKTNVALMQSGRNFDASYNSGLSDDAIPAIAAAIPLMSADDQQIVAGELARRLCEQEEEQDLRSFNFSRSTAHSVLSSSPAFAAEVDCRTYLRRFQGD